jgi:hypothetical protein
VVNNTANTANTGGVVVDPNYLARLEAVARAGGSNLNVTHNPAVPNPAYQPTSNNGYAGIGINPIGIVEEQQTVQAGPAGQQQSPAGDVKAGFKA